MDHKTLTGTGVALVTPFNNIGEVDFSSLKKLVEFVISNGVDFLVAMGTTSEAATLNNKEKEAVLSTIIETCNGRVPVVLGMGGNNTQAILNDINSQNFEKIDAILSVAPYYNKPTQDGMIAHFNAIAESCPVPIILYNVPGRTSSNLAASTVVKLAKTHKNIVAVKEASADFDQIMEIIQNKPKGFSVLSGDDALTMPLMAVGMEGVISVIANAFPKELSDLLSYSLDADLAKAQEIHYKLIDIIDALFVEGNPAGVKAFMNCNNECKNELRLPLIPVGKETFENIIELNKTLS